MKKRLVAFISHPLISGSSIVFIGSFLANIFNYLFNLLMGRWLSVSDYGLLIALSSFLVVFGTINTFLANIFSKFSAKYLAKKDTHSLSSLILHGSKALIVFGLLAI